MSVRFSLPCQQAGLYSVSCFSGSFAQTLPPPYSLSHPPGHSGRTRRLRSGCVLVANLMVLCLAQPLSAEQPPDQQSTPVSDQCTPGFSADDQVLFNFVDTRAGVDFSQYAGMPIGTISYRVLPIFNE